jgi:hypothetical protein
MENKYKYILVAIAFVIAFFMFFLGIKKLSSAQLKKKSFFMTSILIALALIGCNFNSNGGNDLSSDKMDNLISKGDAKRIKELNKTNEWKEFKTFWKDLDNIEPGNNAKVDGYISYAYREDEDYNQKYKIVEGLRKKNEDLKNKLDNLVKMKLLDVLEPTFLFQLCDSRIRYIYYGNTSMMTRMMPSPGVEEKERSIAMLEFKIDTLLNLEKKGKIDSSELKLAMENTLQEANKASLLGIIDYHKMLYYFPYNYYGENQDITNDTLNIVDKTILQFNKSYKEFMKKYDASKADNSQKEMHERYEATKKELDKYNAIYPQYLELIEDLISNT